MLRNVWAIGCSLHYALMERGHMGTASGFFSFRYLLYISQFCFASAPIIQVRHFLWMPLSCVFGVTLRVSCQGTCRSWSRVCVLDQRKRERERNGVSITTHQSPSKPLTCRPTTKTPTQPPPHACWGGKGGSMEISWGIFHSCNTGILLHLDFYNTNCCLRFESPLQTSAFCCFFRRGKIGRIFFTTEVIRFHFGVTVAFEWSKRYETNRFSFPSHFPPIYIQSVLAGYGDSQSNTGFGQGLLNFLRYVLSVWVI